jgi:hypothetical protein
LHCPGGLGDRCCCGRTWSVGSVPIALPVNAGALVLIHPALALASPCEHEQPFVAAYLLVSSPPRAPPVLL